MSDGLKTRLNIYLNDPEALGYELSMRASRIALATADIPLIENEEGLAEAVSKFQSTCKNYWTKLGVESPSHLKIFGSLLHSLTQARGCNGQRPVFWGVLPSAKDTVDAKNHILVDYFHEYCSFIVVYEMLCSTQRQRREPLKFDPLKPPSNPRFTRSMVDYLREWPAEPLKGDRTPYDFYMVFKAMDLYGVETNYC
ncbi:hypothetical protein [Sagittula sp. S175]|uniref:hypothetical protein n=1 Tax=Sagittula sp. S175 TaxID=3415129 RepID=UPI003C7A7A68